MKLKVNVYFSDEEAHLVSKGIEILLMDAYRKAKETGQTVILKIPLGHIVVSHEENEIIPEYGVGYEP